MSEIRNVSPCSPAHGSYVSVNFRKQESLTVHRQPPILSSDRKLSRNADNVRTIPPGMPEDRKAEVAVMVKTAHSRTSRAVGGAGVLAHRQA